MRADSSPQSVTGFFSAVGAFLIWGLSPVFYKSLKHVPPFEILMHRMVWSFILLLPMLLLFHRWHAFTKIFKNGATLAILLGTTMLVACNWFLFIWAINSDHILQASLGYYTNPLVNVLLAMVFLGERLRKLQIAAVLLALLGVIYMTATIGQFPWVALTLAFTFAFYGLLRKIAPIGALEGLTMETLLLFLPATAYLATLHGEGTGAFRAVGLTTDLLLMGCALVTAVPLLLFTKGARRLPLITIGFLQYLAPSCTFLLAVFVYGEPFSTAQAVTFCLIWTALAIFSTDGVMVLRNGSNLHSRKTQR